MIKMIKKAALLLLTVSCLFLTPQCKDAGGSVIDPPEPPEPKPVPVKVTILPAKDTVVDAKACELVFKITTAPVTPLKYSVIGAWIKAINGKEQAWTIDKNETKKSRSGSISIQNANTSEELDRINILQRAVGDDMDNDGMFEAEEVPVRVPFAGTTYITTPKGSTLINNNTGNLTSNWTSESMVLSAFFRVGASGELKLGFMGSNTTGTSNVRFTVYDQTADGQSVNPKSHDVTISGPTMKIYGITTLQRSAPGYVRIDMQGLSKSGSSFGEIPYFRIGGAAASATNNYITEAATAGDENGCYFFRRGPSSHWHYAVPTGAGNIEYFYNEVVVTPENAVNGTYYMMCGFTGGYMGIQQISNGTRKVLFSVWSPYVTDHPGEIPENMKPKLLRKGPDVTDDSFGGEGSGGQSFLNYSWTPGVTYKALVGARPDGKGSTVFTAYFFADGAWRLIASWSRPQTNTWYVDAHSFLENFDPIYTLYTRQVLFKNQWMRNTSGEWFEVTQASYTLDETGQKGLRYDIQGSVNNEQHGFILKGFGFFDGHTNHGTGFKKDATSTPHPDIDFEALEKL
jgi:hypothetical protein